ncbi:MAG: hypothetical protein HRT35_30650, partial [Algicola sp.]|nr:hypothetical protein [Algicola sp.]
MQDLAQLLATVKSKRIKLWVEDEQLKFKAPKGAMTAQIGNLIRDNKQAIILLLSQSRSLVNADAIKPVSREQVIPMSFAQRRMWFLEQLNGQSSAYNIYQSLKLNGALDGEKLADCVDQLVQRHEILRSRLHVLDGESEGEGEGDEPVLAFDPRHPDPLTVRSAQQGEIESIICEHQQQVFDLNNGPLYDMTLVKVASQTHYLLINIHHIVADGWSLGVLVEELMTLYSASQNALPQQSIQYADFAHWQRSNEQQNKQRKQLEYWMDRLNDAPEYLTIARDNGRDDNHDSSGGSLSIQLSETQTAKLSQFCKQHKVSDFIFLLSVFQLHLSRLSGQQSVIVGAPNVGRNTADLQKMMGLLLSTMILRADLDMDSSFEQFLAANKKHILGAMERQDVPFEQIVEGLGLSRNTNSNPLFQVFFNMLNLPGEDLALPGIEIEATEQVEQDSKFDITLYAQQRPAGLHLRYHYNTGLFSEARIVEMLEQYRHLLLQIVDYPEQSIGAYSLRTQSACAVLPNPQQPLDDSWRGDVISLFQQQVSLAPDKLAIESERTNYSYQQLANCSNNVAVALQGKVG